VSIHTPHPSSLQKNAETNSPLPPYQFSLFDLDRDKHLDYHEMRVALRALGFSLPKAELLHHLTAHGVPRPSASSATSSAAAPEGGNNNNNSSNKQHPAQLLIPYPAFAALAAHKVATRDPREEIERAFELFDVDGKGRIDVDDLRRVARDLGETGIDEEELRAMVDEFDFDGSGGVGREAFVRICLQ